LECIENILLTMKIQRRQFAAANENSGDTREKLLDAAQEVFVERGFYDATIRQICKRAGVNLALVNYHFGDKLQLYIEVIRRAMNLSKLAILSGVNDPDIDPVSLLRDVVSQFLCHLEKEESVYDILLKQESLRPTPAMEFITEKFMRPAYGAMCTVIGRILKLPGSHETTRMITNSVIAQIKHFGEPERLLARIDPTILSGKTDEELANFIVGFSLGGLYPHRISSKVAKPHLRKKRPQTKQRRIHSVLP
jgi:AcrR family transcriptional regulator